MDRNDITDDMSAETALAILKNERLETVSTWQLERLVAAASGGTYEVDGPTEDEVSSWRVYEGQWNHVAGEREALLDAAAYLLA